MQYKPAKAKIAPRKTTNAVCQTLSLVMVLTMTPMRNRNIPQLAQITIWFAQISPAVFIMIKGKYRAVIK
jgi:hypothetical protein